MENYNSIWNDYTQLNMLGSSAYGTVYKAKSKKDNKIVSIKEYFMYQKDAEEIYNNEIKYLEELKSKNIINYINTIKINQNYYIIRNYYYGTLEDFIKVHTKKLSLKEIQTILLDLCNAFKLLNEKNLIHRDIKPSNILLSLNGKNGYKSILSGIYLIKKYNENSKFNLRGIRYICPPEELRKESINMKYDIWSVGVLIYYMIEGKYPFEGTTDVVVLNKIQKGINFNISNDTDLNDLIKKTLEKNVNLRISWKDFFDHPFLKKNIGDNNENEDTKKIKTTLIEKKKDFLNSKKRYVNEIKNYSTMIQKYQPDYLKTFDSNIRDKLIEISKSFEELYKSF